jgi:hypothetical protein
VVSIQRLIYRYPWVPHGWNQQQQAPEDPADPEEEAAEHESDRQELGQAAMDLGRESVDDVSAVELPRRD